MPQKKPRLTIGLPVYNGEKFIGAALDSLLAQTFTDFEIIISDNASTDRTEEICRAYAGQDERIVFRRNAQNLGIVSNYNLLVTLARGEYFKWAACDDTCAPTFLEKCVEALDQDSSLVVCHAWTKLIDEQGAEVAQGFHETALHHNSLMDGFRLSALPELKTHSLKAYERFRDMACVTHTCEQMYGVIRLSALKQTPLLGSYWCSDKVLLSRLALLGRFQELPEQLFCSRRHTQRATSVASVSTHVVSLCLDPSLKGTLVFPRCRHFCEYFKAIWETSLPRSEKLFCYVYLLPLLFTEGPGMLKDIIVAAILLTERLYRNAYWKIFRLNKGSDSDYIFGKFPRLD